MSISQNKKSNQITECISTQSAQDMNITEKSRAKYS